MLEGTEDALGYFIKVEVAAFTPDQASTLAIKSAEKEFLHCGSTNTEPGAVATGFNLGDLAMFEI